MTSGLTAKSQIKKKVITMRLNYSYSMFQYIFSMPLTRVSSNRACTLVQKKRMERMKEMSLR